MTRVGSRRLEGGIEKGGAIGSLDKGYRIGVSGFIAYVGLEIEAKNLPINISEKVFYRSTKSIFISLWLSQ